MRGDIIPGIAYLTHAVHYYTEQHVMRAKMQMFQVPSQSMPLCLHVVPDPGITDNSVACGMPMLEMGTLRQARKKWTCWLP